MKNKAALSVYSDSKLYRISTTFTFTLDAFPDYTKFDRTHKVLAAIQVIEDPSEEEGETEREICHPSFAITPKYEGLTITYDNNSTDKNLSITVSGDNIPSDSFDTNEFGQVGTRGNATQLGFRLPVDATKQYTITQQNPALVVFYPDADLSSGIKGSTKTMSYLGSKLATEDYNILLTDKRGPVRIEVKDETDGSIVQNITINYRLSFAKSTVGD